MGSDDTVDTYLEVPRSDPLTSHQNGVQTKQRHSWVIEPIFTKF